MKTQGGGHSRCGNSSSCQQCESYLDSVFSSLPPQGLDALSASKSFREFKRGEVVFRTGDQAEALYCVQNGVIKLESEGDEGQSHILRVVSSGGILGYRALFAEEPYSATAVVHQEASVCVVPKAALLGLLQTYPETTLKILSVISRDLRATESRMVSLTDKDSASRVAEALLFFKDRFPEQRWTRQEIAEWAGVSTETVIRALGQFESEGWLRQQGRAIEITDRRALLGKARLLDE